MATSGRYASWDCDDEVSAVISNGRARSLQVLGFFSGLALVCALPILFSEFAQGVSEPTEPVTRQPQQLIAAPESVSVLVPRFPIKAGEKLIAVQFRRIDVPKDSTRAHAISDPESLVATHARRDLFPDVPLMAEDIRTGDLPNDVAAHIPSGYRAVSLAVSGTSAVEGWASPGANVDVALIAKHEGVDTSNILARDVLVLSVDRKSAADAHTPSATPATITLMLRKTEASQVALAARVGSIVLHLRGWKEREMGGASQLIVKDLYRSKRYEMPNAKAASIEEMSRPKL